MNELALFAGAGGGILGGKLLGWRTVCAVERDGYAAAVLAQRQNDGFLEPFPIWSDVCTFDGRPWRGLIDVVSGGFPCQDISAAGKGAGIDGDRSGLWAEMARIIDEVRPRYVFVENSPLLVSRGLARVIGDLAKMGFDARWGIVGAHHVGAPHKRDRCWIVANANSNQCPSGYQLQSRRYKRRQGAFAHGGNDMADTFGNRWIKSRNNHNQHDRPVTTSSCKNHDCNTDCQRLAFRKSQSGHYGQEQQTVIGANWWQSEPDVGRVANGVAARVDRLKAIGNGQVPLAAAKAFKLLTEQ